MLSFFRDLFDTSGFPPRWHCGLWSAGHGWLHILSDIAIFGAYAAIPLVLVYFIRRRKDVPFLPIFWFFAAFIVACGLSHLIEATIFWHPWYRLSGLMKAVTAVVSWITVIALIKVIPSALALPGLAKINEQLNAEISERKQAAEALRASEAFNRSLMDGNADCVKVLDLDGHLLHMNAPGRCLMEIDDFGPLCGQEWSALWPAQARQDIERSLAAARGGDTYSFQAFCPTVKGTPRWWDVMVSSIRDAADGPVVRVLSVSRDITGRKQAEEALREKEHFLQRITQVIPGVLNVFDLVERRSVFINRSVESVLGYSPEEVQAMGTEVVPTLMHPEDLPRFDLHMARVRALDDGEVADFKHRMRDRASEWHWFLSHDAVFARDAAGAARQLIGVATEITERKRTEQMLADRTELLNGVLEGTTDVVFVKDLNGRVVLVNAAFAAAARSTPEQLVGKTDEDWFPPDVAAAVRQQDEAVIAGGSPIQFEETIPVAGHTRVFLTLKAPLRDGSSRVVGILGISRDITERKRTEEALREHAEILSQVSDTVGMIDNDERILFLNSAGEQLYRVKEADVLGRDLSALYRRRWLKPEDEAVAMATLREYGEAVWELIHVTNDGRELFVQSSVSLMHDATGKVTGIIAAIRDITERKRAEEAVVRLAAIVESSHDALFGEDLDGIITSWNRGAEQIFGYRAEEIVGTSIMRLIPEDRQAAEHEVQRQIVAGELGGTFEAIRLTKEGREFPASITIAPLKDAAGKVTGTSRVVRDITERTRAEESLRASQERMRLAAEATGVGIWEWNVVTNAIRWDALMFRIYGIEPTPDGFVHYRDWTGAVLPEDLAETEAILQDTVRRCGQSTREFRIRRRSDGECRWIQAVETVRVNHEGKAEWVVGTNLDITERRQAQESLLHQKTLLEALTESVVDGILIVSPEGRMIHQNQTFIDIWSFPPEVIERRSDAAALEWAAGQTADPAAFLARVAGIYDRPDAEVREELMMRDGRVYERCGSPIRSGDARLGWVWTFRDITKRKQMEQALRDTDRRKDEFLATLAHELRNPLAPVRNAVEVLRMKGPAIPELQWAREVIDRQTQAMTRLIDDLMDISRINQGKIQLKREQVELAKIVQGAVETSRPLIESMGHELTVTLPPGPVIVDADLTRLAQVFLNLLNNAAKYMERGGRIELVASVEWRVASGEPENPSSLATGHSTLDTPFVVVSVKDTGIGIPADKLPTLFEMFSQVEGALSRSQGGLGIGLCLVKRLVDMHGGSVEVQSGGLGQGSEFVVRLPFVVEQTYSCQASDDGDQATPTSDLRILVVDDNRDAAQSLAMLLQMMGNNVHTAHDGEEAVTAAREFQPHVVLCDIGLPKLNGYEACRQMKAQAWDKKMILIAVTGWGQDDDRRKSEEAGFDHHLVKPVDPQSLMKLLAELESVKA